MCGISGYISYQNKINPKEFYQAHLLLKHRGPDDEGFVAFNSNEVNFLRGDDTHLAFQSQQHINNNKDVNGLFGHRRLSIIDLSPAGHQPYEFKGLYLTYNGEIYNYIELRKELQNKGYQFQTQTDTEVFLKSYHCWGVKAFNKFNGMWAAGIYHSKENRLILTRDHFGIKPLYYAYYSGSLYFASEVKFIRQFVPVTLNTKVAQDYLDECLLDYSNETFFNEINELEPAHWFEFNRDEINIKKYWLYQPKVDTSIDYEQAKKKINELFDSAIDIRMRSDVPIGSLLSGGLDSSAIVNNLSHRQKMPDIFHTYTADFYEKEFSEKKYVDETINAIPSIKSNFIYPLPEKLTGVLEDMSYYQEFPFRSLAVYSQYEIYKNIHQTDAKVLLNGQGSDEQFAGYNYHYLYALSDCLGNGRLVDSIKLLNYLKNNRGKHYLSTSAESLKLLIKNGRNSLTQQMFSEFSVTALREYLRYEDRMSMMASKETRLPFLDVRLIEYVFSLPNSYKIDYTNNKKILRDLVANYVPKEIVSRKDKVGFAAPHIIWQQQPLKEMILQVFSDNHYQVLGIDVTKVVSDYFQGKNNQIYLIWRWFCFLLWEKRLDISV